MTRCSGSRDQILDEVLDTCLDLVADRSYVGDRLACGVVELPVEVLPAGVDRAGVATAHGDDDVGGAYDVVGQRFGELLGDVETHLGHGCDDGGVELVGGLRAGRAYVNTALRVVVE